VYTWGSGDGGRLGHGDTEDRLIPTQVEALRDEVVLQVACGNWHSAAVVQIPPFLHGGQVREGWGCLRGCCCWRCSMASPLVLPGAMLLAPASARAGGACVAVVVDAVRWHRRWCCVVPCCLHLRHVLPHLHSHSSHSAPPLPYHRCQLMTWGCGYKGQLGHGFTVKSLVPKAIEWFLRRTITIAFITCSSYHMAALSDDEQVCSMCVCVCVCVAEHGSTSTPTTPLAECVSMCVWCCAV